MNQLRRFAALSLSTFAVLASANPSPAAPFGDLAKYLPDNANSIVVVNAAALYASPLGQKEGLREKYADRFEAAPLILPPTADRCVIGADLELQSLRTKWEAAAMDLTIDPSPADIALRRGGRNDVLSGMTVTWIGRQLCIFKFAPKRFGAIVPVTRQEAGRWAADYKAGGTGQLSPYLQQSISYADTAGTHVILAVDLSNTFTEANLKRLASQSDVLKGVDPDAAAAVLAGIQGVKFGVVMTDKLVGRVQLDFANDTSLLAPIAKPLILKIVARAGAMLPEFANWKAETTANSLALNGELTPDGMRRVFSLLSLNAAEIQAPETEQASSTTANADDAKAAMGKASLRYFRGVAKYIDDVQRLQQANSIDQAVMWIETYARKIEALPTKNVDPDLVQYGKYAVQTFRAIVDEASGLSDQLDAEGSPVVSNYRIGFLPTARTVNYGGDLQRMYAPYGYADIDPQATQERDQKTQDAISKGLEQAKTALTQLVKDNDIVRTKLTEKYGIKF